MRIRYLPLAWLSLLPVQAAWAAAAASEPSLCQPPEQVLFNCITHARKIASLCASPDLSAKGGTLQYRFGSQAGGKRKIELQYPDTPQLPAGKFFFSSTGYSGGGEAHLRFDNGGYRYILFDRTIRTGFDGNNNPQFSAGIQVQAPNDGKTVTLGCANDASMRGAAYDALPAEDFDFLD